MDQQEAAEVERRLREMLMENNLDWVVEQVDEAIRGGKLGQKEATMLKEYYDEEGTFDFGLDRQFVNKGKTKLTAIEEYPVREKVQLLIDATEQAAVVSTFMANEAIQGLSNLHNEGEPSRIKFVAEDGTEESSADLTQISERSQAADHLRELLDRLRNMVNDE